MRARAQRWYDLAVQAQEIVLRLAEVQEEYRDWANHLPKDLHGTTLGSELRAICHISIDEAAAILEEARIANPPLVLGEKPIVKLAENNIDGH